MKSNQSRRFHRRATDHRALVLESVATSPIPATLEMIVADCADEEFTAKMVKTMAYQLIHEGLLGRTTPVATQFVEGQTHHAFFNPPTHLFLTDCGLDWLTNAKFDRATPRPHERPKARRKKVQS